MNLSFYAEPRCCLYSYHHCRWIGSQPMLSLVSDVTNKNAVIAVIDDVPAAINYVTTPYNNLMSAVRHESAGWSVKPSNVNGIN